MPLLDHFHSPVNDKHRWDAVHGQWPGEIVRTLFDLLPERYVAEPQVHHGAPFEVDIAMIEDDNFSSNTSSTFSHGSTLLAQAPTLTVPVDLSAFDEYEVRIYDSHRDRTLVAAIEIISPSNKDRPDNRDQFTSKVASLLRQDVCVVILDVVTSKHLNLYAELLERLNQSDPSLAEEAADIYVATLRGRKPKRAKPLLDAWYTPLQLGQPLPTIPLWLSPDEHIMLPLEPSYQEVCRLMRIV
jgi:hypothetical protein